jgi:hypothetical protein
MTLQLLHSEFTYIQYEANLIFFFISVLQYIAIPRDFLNVGSVILQASDCLHFCD